MSYIPPVEISYEDNVIKEIVKENEERICQAIIKQSIKVDEEELIKALKYDRNQYEKGYQDGLDDAYGKIAPKVAREIFENIVRTLPDEFPFLGNAVAVYLSDSKEKYFDTDKLHEKIANEIETDLKFFAAGCVEAMPTADVAEVKHGEWEWFEEWSPSTTEHPRECDECGWRCGKCKTPLADIVGGYWDDFEAKPNLHFCPNCGARMDGE